jgi:hypothetical protein
MRRNIGEMCQSFQAKFCCSLKVVRSGYTELDRGLHCVHYFRAPGFIHPSQHPVFILLTLRPGTVSSVCAFANDQVTEQSTLVHFVRKAAKITNEIILG